MTNIPYIVEMEMQKATNNVNYTKLMIVRNLLGMPVTEQELRSTLRRILEASYNLATKESRNGEWAFASSLGWTVWCSTNDTTGGALFHVDYSIEHWDNLD